MSRVAAIDCGTNSLRLLVSDAGVDVLRRMEVVRLGAGVDRSGMLAPDAIERTRVVLTDYARQVRDLGAQRLRMVATSATRDAGNRSEFIEMVVQTLGVAPEVISGEEEAGLSFRGAVADLADVPGPYLVADIGGGSTELVFGTGDVQAAISTDVGCVRLTERHLRDDPPTADQIGAAEADIRVAVQAIRRAMPTTGTFVGVAGSVTTVAAIALGLPAYDPDRIHRSVLSVGQVRWVTSGLLTATRAQRAALPVMHPGRVDVIGGGALVLRVLMDALEIDEVVVSEHDILDGIAAGLAGQ